MELVPAFLDAVRTDRRKMDKFIDFCVRNKYMAMAASLREEQEKMYPETEDIKKRREAAKTTQLALRMVDVDISEGMACLLFELSKVYRKKKGKFSLKDAVEVRTSVEAIYDI